MGRVNTHIHGAFNTFPNFFVQACKIVVDSWKFSMLLLYILWDDWPISMISSSNEQLQQQLEYTLLKHDCHGWLISKMQSGREDTLEERYDIKFCYKLGQNTTETYRMLQTALGTSCMNRASVFDRHKRFKEGRESVRDDERLGGVRKSIDQSWFAKGLGLQCWGFKGVQVEIPTEEASTLEICSVAFPSEQCTSQQLHPCHIIFDQDGYHESSTLFLIVQTLLPVTFGYSLRSRKTLEAVVMRQLRRWKWLWWRSLTRSHKRNSMGPSRRCWNGTTSTLQLEEISSKGTRISCVYYQ